MAGKRVKMVAFDLKLYSWVNTRVCGTYFFLLKVVYFCFVGYIAPEILEREVEWVLKFIPVIVESAEPLLNLDMQLIVKILNISKESKFS